MTIKTEQTFTAEDGRVFTIGQRIQGRGTGLHAVVTSPTSIRYDGDDETRTMAGTRWSRWRRVGIDPATDPIYLAFCVGNSHALIAYERSSSTADCACGTALIRLVDGRWVHGVNRSALCPPYECECGRRHNQGHPTSPVRRTN